MANRSYFPFYVGLKNGYHEHLHHLRRRDGFSAEFEVPLLCWSTSIITHDEFTDADTSHELDLNGRTAGKEFPANAVPVGCYMDLVEVFAGGTISAATVQLGDAGAPGGLFTDQDVFTGATLGLTAVTYGTELGFTTFNIESAFAPTLTLDTTDGNCDDTTTGKVRVHILYHKIDRLATS